MEESTTCKIAWMNRMGVFVAHFQINRLKCIGRTVHWRLKRFSMPNLFLWPGLAESGHTCNVHTHACMHACCEIKSKYLYRFIAMQSTSTPIHMLLAAMCIEREAPTSRKMSVPVCVQRDYRNGYLGALNIVVDLDRMHCIQHTDTPSFQMIINYIRPFNQAISNLLFFVLALPMHCSSNGNNYAHRHSMCGLIGHERERVKSVCFNCNRKCPSPMYFD